MSYGNQIQNTVKSVLGAMNILPVTFAVMPRLSLPPNAATTTNSIPPRTTRAAE